jgi:E3 ubiquitin-protein ligase UBR1
MVAQIRVGLWVRNGFAIRGQLMHYRDYMLRELCFDQDLFNLQTTLVLLDPDVVLVTMLDRFNLTTYFNGVADEDEDEEDHHTEDSDEGSSRTSPYKTSYGEISQLCGMVEELLFVLITILSENASASRMPIPTAVRREIVHALAMGPCGFTELTKRVAERFGEHPEFEKILNQVAVFRPPEGHNDVGLYELREDVLFEDVNPFFFHYTRNRREEVENTLRAKLKKKLAKEGKPDQEWVYIPKKFGVQEGVYKDIPNVFESEVLLQIMFYTVFNVLVLTEGTQGSEGKEATGAPSASTPPSGEAILDQALHLIMLALVEKENSFSLLAAVRKFEEDRNLIDVICALEYHEQYKAYRARVQWILEKMATFVPNEVAAKRREYEALRPAVDPEEARKKAAKARQEAIMQQMKAQQASFAINFDDMDDEDDEMSVDEPGNAGAEANVSFGTCIVCQEELLATGKTFGALGLVQPSRFVRKHPDGQHHTNLNEVLSMSTNLDRASNTKEAFPPLDADVQDATAASSSKVFEGFPSNYTRFGLVSSVCTHMMHLECFQVYSISIRQRHRAQPTRNHPESIPRKEYICPLCKSLGNVILPVINPSTATLNVTPFSDWIRAAGINILKSKPDPLLESLQIRNGTGEFVFWAAQDPGYSSAVRSNNTEGKPELLEAAKMLDTVMVVSKSFSQQTRHLRDRPEPEIGDRGAGLYLPEELLGYTIAQIETAQRGIEAAKGGVAADNLTEGQTKMIRGLVSVLTRLAALQFKGRPEEGRDAVRQAIIKRLLPEWSRTSLTSFHVPLLLRDPFTILVETAAVAPDILGHVLILTYYATLARGVIGIVYILNKTKNTYITQTQRRAHEDIFGDVRMFFMSVVRHSPVFEHTATVLFETFGEGRIEKLLYAFTLPFLRRAAILCRSILPNSFPSPPPASANVCEYTRLLNMLGIPPLSDLPNQDTLQNALSGWCAHYGHTHNVSQLNCGVMLDYPGIYRMARLPLALDTLFTFPEKFLTCARCNMVSNDPGVCLICGTVVCVQSSCCVDEDYNNRGECNMHTRECVFTFPSRGGGVLTRPYLFFAGVGA